VLAVLAWGRMAFPDRPRLPQPRTAQPGLGSSPAGDERLFDGGACCSRRRLRRPLCIPSRALKPPSGPDWVHEIKHDGYRLIVRRDGETVRLFTRRGYDWTGRYPAIASAAAKIRAQSFTLDGEAVVCGEDGVAVFDALHRHGTVRAAILQAFDLLELCRCSPRRRTDTPKRLCGRAVSPRRYLWNPMFFLPTLSGCASTLPLRWRQRLFAHCTPPPSCGVILMADGGWRKHSTRVWMTGDRPWKLFQRGSAMEAIWHSVPLLGSQPARRMGNRPMSGLARSL
jgi:hypothetical protein